MEFDILNMDEEKEKNEVISNIRACLISVKGSVSLRQLETDYKVLCGQRIPYTRLGFKTIHDFISSIPTLSLTKSSSGEYFVDAKVSEKSVHITDMVSKQKNAKKKPITRAPAKPYRSNNYVTPRKDWTPITTRYKPRSNFNVSERTSAVSHNQFIKRSPARPKVNTVRFKPSDVEQQTTVPRKSSVPVNNAVRTSPPTTNELVNGILLNTPLRQSYVKPAVTSPTYNDSNGSRLRSTNLIDIERSPVDLETFSHSLLNNSRKRLSKVMLDVNSDRDSGNSSPVSDDKIPVSEMLTGNPIEDLKCIVELYKLGKMEINVTNMQPKKKHAKPLYNCKITVDGQTYLSYPGEFHDRTAAEVFCAKKALDELLPKCARRRTLLLATSKDVKERIPPMLKAHAQGIWSSRIEEDYADLFFEQLPSNWLEIIDSCDCVAVERIQDDRYVLRYCQPGMKGEKFGSILPPDVSIPSTVVTFGEDNRLCAQISCIMSLNEVWCQQIDTPAAESHHQMTTKMEIYYNEEHEKLKAKEIVVGSYYVANYESQWYRVRALEVQEHTVNCFLIDFGDEFFINKDMICNIKREFALSAAQAFVCRLAGLEDLYDANVPSDKLVSYVGKEVVLAEQVDAELSETDQMIAVDMYDVVEGVSINKQLLAFLTIEIATPVVRQNTIDTVYISHVCEKGQVYIQIHSKGFTSLQTLMLHMEGVLDKANHKAFIEDLNRKKWESNRDKIYLSKDNGHWLRCKVIDMSPNGQHAQVFFIDVGSDKVVKVSEEIFYRLEDISEVIYQFPQQAVLITLALETVPKNFVSLVSGILKVGSDVLMKVIGQDEKGNPIAEFYRRTNDEGLLCINKSIAMEIEISKKNECHSLKGTKCKLDKLTQNSRIEIVPSAGSLMSPQLPDMGRYFPVNIPFTVNPWNFFVQPFESQDELNQMMTELQERYRDTTCSPAQIKNIVPGQIFAAKHTDNIWYRTSVLKVIHSGSISVFYCDFGYYSNLSVSQLVPLDEEFTKLPYQALKAKLSGIKPKKSKWSMEDCEVFSELVKGRALMSVIVDIEKDELYESDPVLKLTLIDTSTDEDIFIHQELIKKNIAIKAD